MATLSLTRLAVVESRRWSELFQSMTLLDAPMILLATCSMLSRRGRIDYTYRHPGLVKERQPLKQSVAVPPPHLQ